MALIILLSHAVCRIDEIHQQLEEQLSVLSHFIDGVANLRPKGLSGVLVMALFVLLLKKKGEVITTIVQNTENRKSLGVIEN